MKTLVGEVRSFAVRFGALRSVLLHLLLLAAFGIGIPRLKGVDFLDSQVLSAYACLGLLFAGPATAQSLSEGGAVFAQAIARILAGVLYGEVVVIALLGTGIATVYLSNRGAYVPTPDWITVFGSVLFGLGASVLFASIAAWVTVRFSEGIARMSLRLMFFGLLVLFFYRGQRLQDVGLYGAMACVAVAVIFAVLLKRACRS
jgi:hypothetical protein